MRRHRIAMAGWLLVAMGCGGTVPEGAESVPDVKIEAASTRAVEVRIPFVGQVESAQSVQLVALVAGQVMSVAVADGAAVEPGNLIVELGGPRVDLRRQVLESAVAAERQRLDSATDRLERARRRAASHLAQAGEVAAAAESEAAAREAWSRATGELDLFTNALRVVAPEAGVFVGRQVSPGQTVSAGDRLGEILGSGSLRVAAKAMPVPGRQVAPGQRALVEDADGQEVELYVTGIRPVADLAGTVLIWMEGKELERLSPGSSVRGEVIVATHEKAVTVPATAVVRDGEDHPLVYVGESAPFVRREVTTGVEGPGWVEITAGVEAGEGVVSEGAYELYWAEFSAHFKMED